MKKTLSIILVVIMLASVFAFTASAETNYKTTTVSTTWHVGYVGSSTHTEYANVIADGKNAYSYTDIIDMGPAGSTITFTDDSAGFASAAAYTISFWKKSGEEYVVDTEAPNAAGKNEKDEKTYTFVTTADNQGIRVCYRSEQKADVTPEFEDVYVDGVKVTTNWNFGYVQPAGTIKENGSAYSYSDIIVVAKAGSKVTITDSNKDGTLFASAGAAVFSTWTKDGDNWVFGSAVNGTEASAVNKTVTYTYTSTKDNELVRLCYRSEDKADAPIAQDKHPVITLKQPVAAEDTATGNPNTGDMTVMLVFALIAIAAVTTYFSVKTPKRER